ncbi:MAG: PH domain-containing protein [Patulibacter minatonensis]
MSGAPHPGDGAAPERHLHPAGIAILAIRNAAQAWFAAVAAVAAAGPAAGIAIIVALLALIAGGAYVEWRVTRYAVVDGGIRYRRGVFARREVDVPASRISALDTSRGILQRLFGVVALQVQTPGGGSRAELVLHAVSLQEAERLRRELGHRGAERAPAATEQDPGESGEPSRTDVAPVFVAADRPPQEASEEVFRMGMRELLLAGATSPSGAFVGAGLAVFYGPISDLLGDRTKDSVETTAQSAVESSPVLAAVLVLAAVVLLSVASTVLAFARFRVTRDDRRLRVRRGLLTERTGTVQLDRIHALRIVETPLRQWLGFVAIEAEVAGWAQQSDSIKAIVPFVRRSELPTLLPALVPGYRLPEGALTRPPSRATRRYVWRALWFWGVLAAGLAFLPIGVWRVAPVAAALALGVGLGVWRAASAGWLVDGHLLELRSRWIARTTVLAQIDRLQQRASSTTPFQERAGLASLSVRLSSRREVDVRYLEASAVAELVGMLRPRAREARRPAG